MKILVIGSGAREHALARSLAHDPVTTELTVAPGNPGTAAIARSAAVDASSPDDVLRLARDLDADLVVIGPEAPLVAGAADPLREAGIAVFGPSGDAAKLEGSKAFAKDVMAAANVPTAVARVCRSLDQVSDAMESFGPPYVIKDDGLAAGKGVVVTEDHAAALAHAKGCLERPDGTIVVESYLDGPEVSLFCLVDGTTVVPLAPAQDFKRLGDGDTGPNTGGMGAYTPLTWAPPDLTDQVVTRVAQPVVDELARRGTPFVGLLYCGLALTSRGVQVVEFNARFGDPETQVVLSRLESSLATALYSAATGTLAELAPLRWSDDAAVTVVIATPGYPDGPATGGVITGVGAAESLPGVHVLHAGTRRGGDGELLAAGGRVLSVTGTGADLAAARSAAYAGVAAITLDGAQFRTDIAAGR